MTTSASKDRPMQTDDLAAQMVREMLDAGVKEPCFDPTKTMESIARRYMEKAREEAPLWHEKQARIAREEYERARKAGTDFMTSALSVAERHEQYAAAIRAERAGKDGR